jgi:hypothetical protein
MPFPINWARFSRTNCKSCGAKLPPSRKVWAIRNQIPSVPRRAVFPNTGLSRTQPLVSINALHLALYKWAQASVKQF